MTFYITHLRDVVVVQSGAEGPGDILGDAVWEVGPGGEAFGVPYELLAMMPGGPVAVEFDSGAREPVATVYLPGALPRELPAADPEYPHRGATLNPADLRLVADWIERCSDGHPVAATLGADGCWRSATPQVAVVLRRVFDPAEYVPRAIYHPQGRAAATAADVAFYLGGSLEVTDAFAEDDSLPDDTVY